MIAIERAGGREKMDRERKTGGEHRKADKGRAEGVQREGRRRAGGAGAGAGERTCSKGTTRAGNGSNFRFGEVHTAAVGGACGSLL